MSGVIGASADRPLKEAQARVKELEGEVGRLQERLTLVQTLDELAVNRPEWLTPRTGTRRNRATANLLLSDLHLDEVVNAAEVGFVNRYDRRIATMRLKRTVERTVNFTRHYISGVTLDGIICWLGGDVFSGSIHDELTQTNEGTILEALVYWLPLLAASLSTLADEYGKVHVPVVVGNHGRMTRKPRAKLRAHDNFDWYLGKALAREFADDPRLSFEVADAADMTVTTYNTRFLFTHGDQFRGGSGISGMLAPLMLGKHRKTNRQTAIGEPFDWMVMGHWHQYATVQGLIVNGSLKGYDEYAFVSNFGYEPPKQAFWLTTPENGISVNAPILPADRKAEKW